MTKINKSVTSHTFGDDAPTPKISKGTITTMGNLINDRAIPERGFSPNVKTGHPVAGSEKK